MRFKGEHGPRSVNDEGVRPFFRGVEVVGVLRRTGSRSDNSLSKGTR